MKLVAAVKLKPSPVQERSLRETLERCNAACTWIAAKGFAADTFRQYDLHKLIYGETKARFGLTAQAVVRSIAKVADAFKVNRTVAPVFRPFAAQPYDERIVRFVREGDAVSIWTVNGRLVVPCVAGEHQKRLLAFRRGECDLMLVRGKWYLACTCDVPEVEGFEPEDWLGVDLGTIGDDTHGRAWLAGLLDGEGHFGIRNATARDGTAKWFRPMITLGITAEEPCRRAQEVTGRGAVRLLPRKTSSGKPIWEWQVQCRDAVAVAKAIQPFLVLKRMQAELLIELGAATVERALPRHKPLTEAEIAKRMALKASIQGLNGRQRFPPP